MKKRMILGLILVLLLPTLAVSAQTDDCQEDLSGKSLQFYHFGDLSGPYTFITTPVLAGFEDAIAYFNANGGVCGAEISTDYFDTGATGEGAQAAWDEFVGRGDTQVMFLYLTDDAERLRNQAQEAKIPMVVAAGSTLSLYGENANEPGWVFSAVPLYHDQLGAFCDYISANWEAFGIAGEPVIGHVSWINAFGQASDTPESRAYCASKGVGYADALYYFPGLPDISVQVNGVINAGANIIYTTSLATGPAQLAGTVEALELRDQVVLAGPNWVLDTSVIALGGESVAGFIGQMPYVWWDEIQHPGVQQVSSVWQEQRLLTAQNPQDAFAIRNIAYLLAWATVDFYRQFMTLAINEVGYDNLDGQAVYDVLTSGVEFAPMQGILRVSFADGLRSPFSTRIGAIRFVEQNGAVLPQVVPLTDWFQAPDLRPAGADVP